MAIEFKRTPYGGSFPAIWRGEAKILPGGFKPAQNNIPVGSVVRRGTLVYVNQENKTAAIIKIAKVLAGGTTTKVRIAKGHVFAAGDVVMKNGVTDKSPVIDAVDTTNAAYDVLTLHSAIAGLAEGDVIVEANAYVAADGGSNAVPAAPKYIPNYVVGADKEFDGKGLPALDIAYSCVVLYPSLSFPILEEWLIGDCLKYNPNILFIKQ